MRQDTLAGRVAIVTGAGSAIGLGRAMSLALVGAGARVAMLDVDQVALEQSAADARAVAGEGAVLPIVADVTKREDAAAAVERTIAELGGLHILVNNAGINPRFPGFRDIALDAWVSTIAVNVHGPFFMARAAIGPMLAQGWGRIIGVTTSLDTMLRTAPYGPSKAAHESLLATIARDVEGTGVTANVLIPGSAVFTNMTLGFNEGDLLKPTVMQAPVVWLASPASAGINGRRFVAELWDERLPIDERLAKASAPIGWPQLGRPGRD
jgi:NAD(P)-dependent dehydrogenase (short-subunit alcohol dehydrogenase family)